MPLDQALSAELDFIADSCFAFLVQDSDELIRFMSIAGYTPQTLQGAVGSESLSMAMVEYFANYEPSLLAMCANAQLDAQRFNTLLQRLNTQST